MQPITLSTSCQNPIAWKFSLLPFPLDVLNHSPRGALQKPKPQDPGGPTAFTARRPQAALDGPTAQVLPDLAPTCAPLCCPLSSQAWAFTADALDANCFLPGHDRSQMGDIWHVFNRTLSNSHFYVFLKHIHAAKLLVTQIIARLLKAFHMSQVMVFLVPLHTGTCLCGVTHVTASFLRSCFPVGTRLVCNTFLIPFYELPVQKSEEREKIAVLTIQNPIWLIRSVSGS